MFKPQVINRFNLYRNGSVLIGISGEVELPEVTNLTDTLEGSGTGGNLEVLVIGLTDTMDMKIPYTTLSKSAFAMMDPNETVDLMLNGAIQGMDSGSGKVSYSQMSIAVRGVVKTFSPGTVKAGGKMNSSVTLSLSYYKIVIDGTTMLEIDKLNGVYIANGKDILKEVRNMC